MPRLSLIYQSKIQLKAGLFNFVKRRKRSKAIYCNYQEKEATNLAQGEEKKEDAPTSHAALATVTDK